MCTVKKRNLMQWSDSLPLQEADWSLQNVTKRKKNNKKKTPRPSIKSPEIGFSQGPELLGHLKTLIYVHQAHRIILYKL